MMKQADIIFGKKRSFHCPVNCPVCRYEGNAFPARFHSIELPRDRELTVMEPKTNHIVFLIGGMLHIRTKADADCHLNAGQCMFIPRTERPEIKAIAPARVIWIDFSNRIVLGGQDCLASTVANGCPSHAGVPILPITPLIGKMLAGIQSIDTPCYHMLKEYDLFFMMKASYSDEELACFFNAILRPSHDFRAFVESNYRNTDSLEDIAGKANLSKSYFIKRFKEIFGISVHQWLVKQKEEQLKQMIINGKYDTKEMARYLGFKKQKGIYQFCRQRFNCSLTELQKRIRCTQVDISEKSGKGYI